MAPQTRFPSRSAPTVKVLKRTSQPEFRSSRVSQALLRSMGELPFSGT